jgi:phosphohistidine swiveling domain-containing protein
MVFDWVLRHTAESIADRERQRLRRARVYDTARGIARAFGRRWALAGHLDRPDDIFYLELGETRAFVGGTMPCPELKALVRMRKQAYQAYAGIRMPDRFETKGEAAAAFGRISAPASDQAGVLRGTGCSSGVVQGPVIVVEEPSLQMEIDGRIAVTRQTDPGWIFFFTRMAGLIVERGSMLSHSAIVARETGLPAVFGVEHATLRLHTGDLVRLDGGAGTVTVVSRTAG